MPSVCDSIENKIVVCTLPVEEPWRVLRAETGKETIVRDMLLRQDVEAYVPTGRQKRQRFDTITLINAPLFPSYLFLRYDPARTVELLDCTPYTYEILKFSGSHALIENHEIERVRLMAANPDPIDVIDRLEAGALVRVTHGPLMGLTAYFAEIGGQDYVWCNVPFLGRSVRSKIPRMWVEPIKAATA